MCLIGNLFGDSWMIHTVPDVVIFVLVVVHDGVPAIESVLVMCIIKTLFSLHNCWCVIVHC
jgi:hypothetical protein